MKTLEQNFADWEGSTFGYGYGSGEPHIVPAVKRFLGLCKVKPATYAYEDAEQIFGAVSAWLLINALCRADIIEYGSSPRYGWLTKEGLRLRDFMYDRTAEQLVEIATHRGEADDVCYPDVCNCGPNGYQEGVKCPNPFWPRRT